MKKMNDTLFEELYALLTGKGLKELKDALSEMPYPDIAEFIMALDDELDEEKLAVKVFVAFNRHLGIVGGISYPVSVLHGFKKDTKGLPHQGI